MSLSVESENSAACLDSVQLAQLERAFREWARSSSRKDILLSRRRILLIFLLIRHTGAKLNEVLSLNPFEDIDLERHHVRFRGAEQDAGPRLTPISESLARELQASLADPAFKDSLTNLFDIDPAFVRRKCYEQAERCGFDKRLGSPEMIRKARAVELTRGNLPLPAVRIMLGQSTAAQAASLSFSEEDLRQVARLFLERESDRKTSARNAFFGKITAMERGDVQTRVELITADGHSVSAMITNSSRERLGLASGGLVTAEVKAPYVILQRGSASPSSSIDNVFAGTVVHVSEGKVSAEYVVRISEAAELCSVVSTASGARLELKTGDPVWAMFSCFAVVLHV